ncbi:ATP-dependent DNA helicase RecG [Hydrogenimonas sp.]
MPSSPTKHESDDVLRNGKSLLSQKLKKAGFSSLLELAVHLPSSYLDTRLSDRIEIGEIHTIQANVQTVRKISNRLVVTVTAPITPQSIEVVIFHPQPYHLALFKPGTIHYLQGKIEVFAQKLQMVNPKKVSQIDKILPQYKCKLRQDLHRRLVASLVTPSNLIGEGISEEMARLICRAHSPDAKWLALYGRHNGIGPKTLEAVKFAEALDYFRKMSRKRQDFTALAQLTGDAEPFIARLPFRLTKDQEAAIEDIRRDLGGKIAARRMIVGDVGSGKTMVILAAAMIAWPNKAILMAPTSILARQLYEEAVKWLPEKVNIALVTQSTTAGDAMEAHFVIGTHALLYKELPPAPLVMVDEQHRFGTEQRKKLELLVSKNGSSPKKRPHFLQFSATPIPRTQAMMSSALVDVTLIESTPFVKDIETKIIGKEGFLNLLEHMEKEIGEGRQVLVVYPLVQESEHIGYRSLKQSEDFWKSRFEGVYVTHGGDPDKERVLEDFSRNGKILLSTTVVEVGISLPKLSTIVIVGAERMGLATLHQLRGRVSRTGLKGYCFLFTHAKKSERLEAFTKVKSGFDIAKLDLKFREAGDLLDGRIQSGKSFRWIDMAEDEEIVKAAKMKAEELKLRENQKGLA